MSDLPNRLRAIGFRLADKAAAEILQLEAEIAKLREDNGRLKCENVQLRDSLPTHDNRSRNEARVLIGQEKVSRELRESVEVLICEEDKLREIVKDLEAEIAKLRIALQDCVDDLTCTDPESAIRATVQRALKGGGG